MLPRSTGWLPCCCALSANTRTFTEIQTLSSGRAARFMVDNLIFRGVDTGFSGALHSALVTSRATSHVHLSAALPALDGIQQESAPGLQGRRRYISIRRAEWVPPRTRALVVWKPSQQRWV